MTASTALRVAGLAKSYGRRRAVTDVSFTAEAGEIVAVLGPNGAGKTTTVEVLEGFLRRDAGAVEVLGQDPERAGRAWRARIGMMPQATNLEPELTVRETLQLYAGLYPAPRAIAEVLEMTGLTDDAGTRAGALSGGRPRRADLALAIIGDPELLFLDEPTTGFDPAARRLTWQTINTLAEAGSTVILTTHYLEEAERLADRVVVVAAGRVVANATPAEIRARAARTVVGFRLPAGITLADLPPGLSAARTDGGRIELTTADAHDTVGALVDWSRRGGWRLDDLTIGQPSFEDAYLTLTEGDHAEEPAHV